MYKVHRIFFGHNLYSFITSTKSRLFLIAGILAFGLVFCWRLAPSTAQLPSEYSSDEVGLVFIGSRKLNSTSIRATQYTGECPGFEETYQEARFTSKTVPTARKRRVVIRNISIGVDSDPYPYTDREYDQGRLSEATRVRFDTHHSDRYFHVLEGKNDFEYEIKQGKVIIESGSFTAFINRDIQKQERHASLNKKRTCANSRVTLSECADIRTRESYECSDGYVVHSYLVPNLPDISTVIYNQTTQVIDYSINDRRYQLFPAEFRVHLGEIDNFLGIRFSGKRSSYNLRAESLEPGKRYQFLELDNDSIQLRAFPKI
ncbi:MAG: hypothetical protein F6K58_24145 [Symploca sp. SIO2E9]|nr:hypothetical protein [Symploca sp. SIO2E9]